jgi:hypothetical protein
VGRDVEDEESGEGDVVCREVWRGEDGGAATVVCVFRRASASRWRRSNSACWSAGRRRGAGAGSKVEEGRGRGMLDEKGRVVVVIEAEIGVGRRVAYGRRVRISRDILLRY